MEIREIDGKRYIKFDNVLIVIITAIVCLIIGMFVLIWVYDSNAQVIKNNPLIFGGKMFNVTQCECSYPGGSFFFNQERIWKISENKQPMEYKFNLSKVEELERGR